MQWSEEGVILGTRRHGETSLIVELMTAEHGRHLGLVKGARRSEAKALYQPGNTVVASWRARLDEHLGNYTLEPVTVRAARLMETGPGLFGLQLLTGLTRLLPERDPHPTIYFALALVLDSLDDPETAGEMLVRFELEMLRELGYGLDLDSCAATGEVADLAYVSPKSGRAVSRKAGAPYCDRLLALPGFLRRDDRRNARPSADEVRAGFGLTGFFLRRHVLEPRQLDFPAGREQFIAQLSRMPDRVVV